MPPALRRFAWWSFYVTEVSLVAAASAYVGFDTREFWLVVGAAAVASVAYAIAVRRTTMPKLGQVSGAQQRWYWF